MKDKTELVNPYLRCARNLYFYAVFWKQSKYVIGLFSEKQWPADEQQSSV